MHYHWRPQLGAIYHPETNSTTFRVWSPPTKHMELVLLDSQGQAVPMQRDGRGYFSATVNGANAAENSSICHEMPSRGEALRRYVSTLLRLLASLPAIASELNPCRIFMQTSRSRTVRASSGGFANARARSPELSPR